MRLHVRCILAVCGLCLSLLLLNGCETVKGAVKGGAEGISKDLQAVQKADDWIRKNLW